MSYVVCRMSFYSLRRHLIRALGRFLQAELIEIISAMTVNFDARCSMLDARRHLAKTAGSYRKAADEGRSHLLAYLAAQQQKDSN